jgi:hypothetical protein
MLSAKYFAKNGRRRVQVAAYYCIAIAIFLSINQHRNRNLVYPGGLPSPASV